MSENSSEQVLLQPDQIITSKDTKITVNPRTPDGKVHAPLDQKYNNKAQIVNKIDPGRIGENRDKKA